MAQKKTATAPAKEAIKEKDVVEAPSEVKAPENEAPKNDKPEVKKAPKVEKPVDAISEKTVKIEELPDYAKRVLQLYPDEPELYISKKGGVFSKNTQPALRGSAILFKNPYYKS